jgi:small subunit ribosomal protein S3Ae
MIDKVREAARERTFEELISSVVEGRLSSAIYAEAKEIYPLRRAEVMKTTLEASPEEIEAEEEAAVDVDAEDVEGE